jgi:hypothetical protein
MSADELDLLAEDIRDLGQKYPIRRLPDGRLLDGRNRELACRIAGVEPYYETTNPAESEVPALVASLNLLRRHLTVEERREWVALFRESGYSLRRIAKLLGVGVGTVHRDLTAGVPNGTPDDPVTGTGGEDKTHPPAPEGEGDDHQEGAEPERDDEPTKPPPKRSGSRSHTPDPTPLALEGIRNAIETLDSRAKKLIEDKPFYGQHFEDALRESGITVEDREEVMPAIGKDRVHIRREITSIPTLDKVLATFERAVRAAANAKGVRK